MNPYFVIKVTFTQLGKATAYGAIGGFITLLVLFVLYLDGRPDLKIWHVAELDAEFTTSSKVDNFSDYLALEEKLFAQLENDVLKQVKPVDQYSINRYHHGSLSDPERWERNWNRSFTLIADAPKAGILLLHGMSDSPYSLRELGQALHNNGASVIGLRLPGHGTAPTALTTANADDMLAAVRLAMRHLAHISEDQPLYILGYSTGGGLALQYVIDSIENQELPAVQGVAMLSPAVGVSAFAALAVWQARIGDWLGLDKLEWNSLLPEYDPFKYSSFAVNAGDQVYRLTQDIAAGLKRLKATGKLLEIPPILAFQSVVDATVSTPALVNNLFRQLPESGHELVIFDINHTSKTSELLTGNPDAAIEQLLQDDSLNFTFSVISNIDPDNAQVAVSQKAPHSITTQTQLLPLTWPGNVYSLSHVALPFSSRDPLYGSTPVPQKKHIYLGQLSLKGEKGTIRIPAADMIRQRWNPFYPYVEQRIIDFMRL